LCSFVFYPALQTFASKYVAELYEAAICCLNHINKNVFQQKKHLGSLEVVFWWTRVKWSQRWKRFDRIIPGGGKQTSTKTLYSLGGFFFWFPKIAFARKEKLLFGDRNGTVYQEMPTMRTESQGDASTTSLSCQTPFFSFRSKQPKKVGICAAPVNVLV